MQGEDCLVLFAKVENNTDNKKKAGYGAHRLPERQATVSMQYHGGWWLTWW